jgi:hypothetical protein
MMRRMEGVDKRERWKYTNKKSEEDKEIRRRRKRKRKYLVL